MQTLRLILVVVGRAGDVAALMRKPLRLARSLGAKAELFLCDSEQAYVLGHAYDRQGIVAARTAAEARARRYLSELRDLAGADDLEMTVDAQCESPLYESVVRKVLRSAPDMVVKLITSADPRRSGVPDANDWQLMRTCPATLMLSRKASWRDPPRFAAAIDVSEAEPAEVAASVLEAAVLLARGFDANLHVLYGETGSPAQSAARLGKLRELCNRAGVASERLHVLAGLPERSLTEFAGAEGYDALVLGALAHRGGATTPVGTLTSTLLEALDCDFILVKPPSYRSPIEATLAQS
jgi:universal stress protein E